MMAKKGMTMFLVYVIIALASFALIVSLIGMTMRGCERTYNLRACHDELLAEDVIFKKIGETIKGAETQKPWPNACKTQGPTTIKGNNENQIMRTIAEDMTQCFWALGESGKAFDPFEENWLIRDEKCHTCKIIKIEGTDKEINKDDFNQWLLINNIEGDINKPTYWNYLRTPPGKTASPLSIGDLPIVIDNMKPGVYYALVYQDFVSSAILGIPKDHQTDSVFLVDLNKAEKCNFS